jgi:site-specific DNA-cytosine methylase
LFDIIADGIAIMQPGMLFAENVEGLLTARMPDGSSVFGHCIERLESLHYRVTAGIFSASEVGAPHQRKRIFILAVSSGFRGASGLSGSFTRYEGQSGEFDDGGGEAAWPSRPGEQQYAWEPPRVIDISPECPLGRDIDGSSGRMDYAELCITGDNRTDELRLLGNGVVPATAELAYRTLAREFFTA